MIKKCRQVIFGSYLNKEYIKTGIFKDKYQKIVVRYIHNNQNKFIKYKIIILFVCFLIFYKISKPN